MTKTTGSLALLLQERARTNAGLLRHRAEAAILFADVVGSTSYYDRFGNTAGIVLMQRLDQVTNAALAEYEGRWIKSTSDLWMAEFSDSVLAVRAAVGMQQKLFLTNQQLAETERIQLRIGIHLGEVFRKGEDVWGNAVNVAAGVCAQCGPAQILISGPVQSLLPADSGLHVNSLGRFSLRAKQQQEELFEVIWADNKAYDSLREDVTQMVARSLLVVRNLTAASGPEMPVLGGVFAGRYEILQELGVSGMGAVFKASDRETGETLALKVLRADVASDAASVERFKKELRMARWITHPNVCRVYDFGRASGTAFISMEFVEGSSVRDLLDQQPMDPRDALQIAADLCDGLAEIHRHEMVHWGVTPNNIMVTPSMEVKLMDFGIAGFANTALTQAGVDTSFPRPMTPEQAAEEPDSRTDVYALGLVLYEMMTHRPAFDRDTATALALKQLPERPPRPRQLQPDIPVEAEQIILKCLESDPDNRYRTATEVRNELLRVAESIRSQPATLAVRLEALEADSLVAGQIRTNPRDGQVYVWIPPGTFEQGALPTDQEAGPSESPQHTVTITRGFWIGQTPVTVIAYRHFAKETGVAMPDAPWKDRCPITGVTWDEALAYCCWAGGRLPTSAEWSYAARAGYHGPRYGEPQKIAWFRVKPPGPRPVKGKDPNAWGLYDMLGNVWEWCADWFEEYQAEPLIDPQGPAEGDLRVLRGGSWDDHPRMARLSARSWRKPDSRSPTCGFRCVLDAIP
jgi:formylglycine-generating enzyme required for sulfatase activity/class 3 adenylate cyclase